MPFDTGYESLCLFLPLQPKSGGYVAIRDQHAVWRAAHRALYEELIGPVPPGLQLDHLCRERACVNVWHLEPVTPAENARRGDCIAARNYVKTACDNGHPFDEENTYWRTGRDGRDCKTCHRARQAKSRAKRRVLRA